MSRLGTLGGLLSRRRGGLAGTIMRTPAELFAVETPWSTGVEPATPVINASANALAAARDKAARRRLLVTNEAGENSCEG